MNTIRALALFFTLTILIPPTASAQEDTCGTTENDTALTVVPKLQFRTDPNDEQQVIEDWQDGQTLAACVLTGLRQQDKTGPHVLTGHLAYWHNEGKSRGRAISWVLTGPDGEIVSVEWSNVIEASTDVPLQTTARKLAHPTDRYFETLCAQLTERRLVFEEIP